MKKICFTLLAGVAMLAGSQTQGQIVNIYSGTGNLNVAGSWSEGALPGASGSGEIAQINSTGALRVGNTLGAWASNDVAIIVDSGATVFASTVAANDGPPLAGNNGTGDWGHVNAISSTWNNATLFAEDDIFANSSTIIANVGSSLNAGDDFEANGNNANFGTVIINGGTHTAGDSFGQQNNGVLEVLGGTVSASRFRLDMEGTFLLGGDGTVNISGGEGGGDGYAGVTGVNSDWTGSFTIGAFSAADWISQINTEGFTIDGAVATVDDFVIDGSTISLATQAVPEPSSMVVLGLGTLGLVARRRRS